MAGQRPASLRNVLVGSVRLRSVGVPERHGSGDRPARVCRSMIRCAQRLELMDVSLELHALQHVGVAATRALASAAGARLRRRPGARAR